MDKKLSVDMLLDTYARNVESLFVEDQGAVQARVKSYEPPNLTLEEAGNSEVRQFGEDLKYISNRILEENIEDLDAIYEIPEFRLSDIPKEDIQELLQNSRRNGFGRGAPGQTDGAAYIAAGVVAVIGAKKVHSIVSKKFENSARWPDDIPLGPDDGPLPNWGGGQGGGGPVVPRDPGWTDPPPPDFELRLSERLEPALRMHFNEARRG